MRKSYWLSSYFASPELAVRVEGQRRGELWLKTVQPVEPLGLAEPQPTLCLRRSLPNFLLYCLYLALYFYLLRRMMSRSDLLGNTVNTAAQEQCMGAAQVSQKWILDFPEVLTFANVWALGVEFAQPLLYMVLCFQCVHAIGRQRREGRSKQSPSKQLGT